MTTYYLDTSALAKRYVDERGSGWLRGLLDTRPLPTAIIVHLAIVEMTSALMRRLREGVLSPEEYSQLQAAFRSDCVHRYEIVIAVGEVINEADLLLEQFPLRAYDALHLAAAILTNRRLVDGGLPPLTFLSADDRLNEAASMIGLTVDNPNQHV